MSRVSYRRVQKTAILFTEMVLGEFGQASLIAFDQRVRLMQDFTNDDPKEIEKALKEVTLGSDAVRLSDAVYDGIRMLVKRPSTHRKVIVVICRESQETASEVGLGETMRTAQIHDIMVYPIRLSSIKGWFKRDDKPIPPSIPPGVQARASIPGAADTPTTHDAAQRVRATPNV